MNKVVVNYILSSYKELTVFFIGTPTTHTNSAKLVAIFFYYRFSYKQKIKGKEEFPTNGCIFILPVLIEPGEP